MSSADKRAVFIDRDGTLNAMVYDPDHGVMDSPRRVEQVRVLPGAADFLRGVRGLGYLAVVVTNQPGIAKGSLSVPELDAVNRRLAELLAEAGARWDDLLYCPHHPDGDGGGVAEYVMECECRKPQPGMLYAAAQRHGIDLGRSWMVGDGITDVQAGRRAGCRTILVTRLKVGTIEKFLELEDGEPDAIAPDLPAALEIIRAGDGSADERRGT